MKLDVWLPLPDPWFFATTSAVMSASSRITTVVIAVMAAVRTIDRQHYVRANFSYCADGNGGGKIKVIGSASCTVGYVVLFSWLYLSVFSHRILQIVEAVIQIDTSPMQDVRHERDTCVLGHGLILVIPLSAGPVELRNSKLYVPLFINMLKWHH